MKLSVQLKEKAMSTKVRVLKADRGVELLELALLGSGAVAYKVTSRRTPEEWPPFQVLAAAEEFFRKEVGRCSA